MLNCYIMIKVKLLTPNARVPKKGTKHSAGFDLYSAYDYTLDDKCLVKTDLSLAIPHGYYGRVAPRSSLALKHSIDVGAGVIDSDYRGGVCVILFNFSDVPYHIKKGDRVAQLIIEKIGTMELSVVQQLDDTVRNNGGFGSTGV